MNPGERVKDVRITEDLADLAEVRKRMANPKLRPFAEFEAELDKKYATKAEVAQVAAKLFTKTRSLPKKLSKG